MLFDLQSRGRRNVVKFIYLWLAILLGGGLVLFGVGAGTGGGGLLDAFTGGGTDTSVQVSDTEKRLNRVVQKDPQNAKAWMELARARYQTAGLGENYDAAQQTFTESGVQKLQSATTAWQKYLALEPKKPDANVARLMARAYADGLNQPAAAADALEIVTGAQPSAASFGQLAQYAYYAGQMRKGDLAADKAVELTPVASRKLVKRQLATVRRQIIEQQVQQAVENGAGQASGG
ncbi:MAG: hypothetical protein WBC33_08500 [Conexibacter sp.]